MSIYLDNLEKQADILFARVSGWETNALRRIGRRVKKIGTLSYADLQAINNAAIVNQDVEAVMKELAELTGQNVRDVQKMYNEMIAAMHEDRKALYDYRNKPFIAFADNKELQAITRAFAKTTAATFVNLSMTKAQRIGFVDDVGTFKPINKAFKEVIDKAVMSVSTGTGDYNSEMLDVLRQLGGSGVRVDYGNGITRSLDSMVRQNVLWGAKQTAKEYEHMVGDELGCDGIEIDWHSYPRPSHEFMQGRQFILGKSRTANGKWFDGTEDTTSPISGKNVINSLDDYGCLHFETRIICGVSEPAFSPEERERLDAENKRPIEIDGVTKTGYQWKQTMHRLERAGKEARLKRETFKAAGNNTEARNQSQRLKAIEEKYQLIADKTGIKAQYEKMAIVKGKMSISKPQHHIEGNVVKIKGNDSSALTKQLAKELMEQADIFENKFGTLTKLTEIRPMRYDNDGVWGGYNDNSGVLSLYGIGGKNGKNTMVKVAKKMNKQGKWSTASPYHAFRHELGHAWLDQQEKTSTYNKKILSIKKIKEDILLKLTNNEESDKIIMKNNLSTYGLTPEAEIDDFICECLAEYANGKPRATARKVVEILLKE